MLPRLPAAVLACSATIALTAAEPWFGIHVIDEQTRRGVPMVELETVNKQKFMTDSNGWVALAEPGWAGQQVYFHVRSHGYEFPKDGFGNTGKALTVTPGGKATIALKRRNIAERLYRLTGEGIYRDSVLLGEAAPLKRPTLNGLVLGQDTVFAALYKGRVQWLWGDTDRLAYPLGCFRTTGATSQLPGKGGLDPDVGVDYEYFTGKDGFARAICPMPDEKDGLFWMAGLQAVPDQDGRERLMARYTRIQGFCNVVGHGIAQWNDETQVFDRAKALDMKEPWRFPEGHPFRWTDGGQEWVVFGNNGLSLVRTRATCEGFLDTSAYEAFTCVAEGVSKLDGARTRLQRDEAGKLHWRWTRNAPPLTQEVERDLVKKGSLSKDEARFQFRDTDGKDVAICNGSIFWNGYRKAWVLIGQQKFGTSPFGEIWFGAAPSFTGPWTTLVKVVTHENYTFYNPTQHPFLDKEGGRFIYFEASYTDTFANKPVPTPRYNYNQIMYRLDLTDTRLKPASE